MYLSRGYLLLLIFSFTGLMVGLLMSANQAYLQATMQQANQTRRQIQTQRETLTSLDIFWNNLLVSLPLLVPALGLVPFAYAWNNTGAVIGLLCKAYGVTPAAYIGSIVITGFPELLAYTILVAENIYLTLLALFKAGAKQRITTQSWKTVTLYFLLLFAAAVVEGMAIA